jgi:N-acetylglucosamine-6-phosphate deacetylase
MQQVVRLTSSNAAVYLGLTDRGAIAPGLRADLVVLDMDQVVQQVWVGGARAV